MKYVVLTGKPEKFIRKDWCEPYYILEVKKSFQPVIKISAEISLKGLDII